MDKFIKIMGVRIDKLTLDEAEKKVYSFLRGKEARSIYTPNTEIVMRAQNDDDLKKILNKGDMVIPDGIGLIYASRIRKKSLPERVTGFDLSMKIIDIANKEGYGVFLMGGAEGVAKEAGEVLKRKYPDIRIAGYHHGYFKGTHSGYAGHDEEKSVIEEINQLKADILFVGFGAPKQEMWINQNIDKLNSKVIIGNGGTIDILAGKSKRAPLIYQKLGLEWAYRLAKEPQRIKRQMVLPLFMLKVLFSRKKIIE